MKAMSDSHHLVLKGGVWYFRRRVPEHLIAALGKKVIQQSLGTSDKKKAKQLREVRDVEWSARFEEHEQNLNAPVSASASAPLSKRDIAQLVRDYVERMDQRLQLRYTADRLGNEAQRSDVAQDIEIGLQTLTNLDDPRGDERVHVVSAKILAAAGQKIEGQDLPFAAFAAELVRRALHELDSRSLAMVKGDHSRAFFDQFFNPSRPPDVTFGDLAAQFLEAKLEDAAANDTGKKWRDKFEAHLALIREIIGDDTPVATVDYDMCMKARSTLSLLPANRTKIYGKAKLDYVIKRAAKEGRPMMSSITQQGYLRALTDVLDLALRKRLIPSNPAVGLSPIKRDDVSAGDKRLSFDPDQLAAFFHSDFYKACAQNGPAPFKHDKDGWRFWLPLISLFTGSRPNEICQMHLNDIKQTKAGVWYFDIVVADGDDDDAPAAPAKKLKTATSRRKIPLHPQLIKIGLLDYRDGLRHGKKASLLFPTLQPDATGYFSTYPTKRFRETFLKQAMTLKPRQSFYSFRHTFRDALRAINAPPDTLQALGGWSQGKLASDNYGTQSNPDIQVKYMDEISYPGLDLAHLWCKN